MNSLNYTYTWIGQRWMPPPGIPLYSVTDMIEFFSNHNVLWMGDSTMRRAYATLFAMMNATDKFNVGSDEVDSYRVIDINKPSYELTYPREHCVEARSTMMVSSWKEYDREGANRTMGRSNTTSAREEVWPRKNLFFLCRSVPFHPPPNSPNSINATNEVLNTSRGNSSTRPVPPRIGKFDYGASNCYKDIVAFQERDLQSNNITSGDYDLLVVGLGTHEAEGFGYCRKTKYSNVSTELDRMHLALTKLSAMSSPSFRVVWRTIGFHVDHMADSTVHQLNQAAKEYIETQPYMTYVDWAAVIAKRSFGKDRIRGDLNEHYGLEARLLFIQMLMHELLSQLEWGFDPRYQIPKNSWSWHVTKNV